MLSHDGVPQPKYTLAGEFCNVVQTNLISTHQDNLLLRKNSQVPEENDVEENDVEANDVEANDIEEANIEQANDIEEANIEQANEVEGICIYLS